MFSPYKIENDLIFVNKPAGMTTHASAADRPGMLEWVKSKLPASELWPVHRLDRNTTGCLAFATTASSAEQVRQYFTDQKVQKTYLFVTASRSENDEASVENHLELQNKKAVQGSGPVNAKTVFKRLKRNAFFELWQATPLTGKTHQIRKHAQLLGLPLLGDALYGGQPFPHLCLHAASLQFPDLPTHTTPAPVFMDRMGLLRDSKLCSWLADLDRRQRLFGFVQQRDQSFRLVNQSRFRLDSLGPVLWGAWYAEDLTAGDQIRLQFLSQLCNKPLTLQRMQNRGSSPNTKEALHWGDIPDTWIAGENNLRWRMRLESGLSAGLFLDQRDNRQWIQDHSQHFSVLNLFAYTCSQSVAAAKGGASLVASVDVSRKYLEWGKENFALNEVPVENHRFYARDCLEYLRKNKDRFDCIICDPPSFGRSQSGTFKLESHLDELVGLLKSNWTENGWILFSCNLESWDRNTIQQRLQKYFKPNWIQALASPLDFELPHEEPRMKSFRIQKNRS